MTAVKTAFEYALSKSRNVGCEWELAANFADATTPQTVAISSTWPTASSGLRDAARARDVRGSNAAATITVARFRSEIGHGVATDFVQVKTSARYTCR
jgi:hypothetical protein